MQRNAGVRGKSGWFADLAVITKILTAVLVVALLGAGVASFAVVEMAEIHHATGEVYNGSLQLRTIGDMSNSFNRVRIDSLNHFATDDAAAKRDSEKLLVEELKTFAAAEAAYRRFDLGPVRLAALAEFDAAWASYQSVLSGKLLPLSRADRRSDVAAVRKSDIDPLVATARKHLETMTAQTVLIGQQHDDRAFAAYARGAGPGDQPHRRQFADRHDHRGGHRPPDHRPLAHCVKVLTMIRDGDLTVRTGIVGRDEVAVLAQALDVSTDAVAAWCGGSRTTPTSWPRPRRSCPPSPPRCPRPRRRPPPRPARSPTRPVRSRPACRPWPPAPSRWARRSGRSRAAPPRPPPSPPRRSTPRRGPTRSSPSWANRRWRSAAWSSSSPRSPSRPTCSPSTPPSRPPAPARWARASREMARSINEAAMGANDIAGTITGVAQAAGATAAGATETQVTAQELARMATELQQTVGGYRA